MCFIEGSRNRPLTSNDGRGAPARNSPLAMAIPRWYLRKTKPSEFVYYLRFLNEVGPKAQERYYRDPSRVPPHDTYVEKLVALHNLVLELRPARLLEIGVKHGFTTYAILSAVRRNRRGRLTSIDMEDRVPMLRLPVGHVVPAELRRSWELKVGDATDLVPTLGPFDFVCEDVGAPLDFSVIPLLWDSLAPGGTMFIAARTTKPEYEEFAKSKGGWASKAEGVATRRAAWGVLKKG